MAARAPTAINIMGPRMARSKAELSFMLNLLGGGRDISHRAAHSLVEHKSTEGDQPERPIAYDLAEVQDFQVVQQEQQAEGDQHDGPGGEGAAVAMQRDDAREFVDGHAHLAPPRGVVSLEGHVEDPHADEHPENRLETAGRIGADDADEHAEDDDVDQAF